MDNEKPAQPEATAFEFFQLSNGVEARVSPNDSNGATLQLRCGSLAAVAYLSPVDLERIAERAQLAAESVRSGGFFS